MVSAYATSSDPDLFSLLKEGNRHAYAEIYNRYKVLLYIHAYKMLQDSEASKDVVQELFTGLWVKREQLDVRISLSSYLYTAVRNSVLDRISRKRTERHYIESVQAYAEDYVCITDHRVREKELAQIIEKEISALPRKMRHIFELSRKDHLSHKQIADQLQLSEKTVKKQINNALKVLRVRLGDVIFIAYFADFL